MSSVTLKDIAKECGVSFSSVSKALKGSPEIGAATIKLVTETAKRMGYQPNMAARALRTNRSYDIGLIFEDSTGSGLQHQYFAEIFDSINVSANLAGYSITFLNSENKSNSTYFEQALYRGCDGIIIVTAADFERPDIQQILESDIPVSILDYVPKTGKFSVMSDNYNGMKQLTEYIISKGHKKIAYIHGEPSEVTFSRIKAYKDALAENGISFDENFLRQGQYHGSQSSEKQTEEILLLKDRPTCIIYPDDFACLGGLKTLTKFNLSPGKDISIAGYDGILLASLLTPSLTTYAQNAKALGSNLTETLIMQIESKGKKLGGKTHVSGCLVEGASVKQISD